MTQDGRDSAASHIGKSLGPASRDRTEGTAPLQSQFVTVEAKVEAMILSVVNLQEAYAKALLVDRQALRAAQQAGDVLGGHEVLLDAFNTDVRPQCAASRVALGAAENPIRAFRESGYAARMATERETQQELTR